MADPGGLLRLVPVLTARDVGPQVAFWERLGFAVTADFGGYVILATSPEVTGIEVHLSTWDDHDPYRAGSVYLRVADARPLYDDLRLGLEADGLLHRSSAGGVGLDEVAELRALDAAGTPYVRLHDLEAKPWGQVEFAVIDPAGWLVRVGSPTPEA